MVYRGLYSYRRRVRVITLFLNIFLVLFLYVERVCKRLIFESVHVAHLHNTGRALSSLRRCFQCQQILTKISFVIFDIVVKNKSNVA